MVSSVAAWQAALPSCAAPLCEKTSNNTMQKREAKKMKKIAKEKQRATMFEEALGRMGLDFDSEAHMCI